MGLDEFKVRVPSLLWIPLLISGALLFFVDVFQLQYYSRVPVKEFSLDQKYLTGFTINTPGCRIPYMDPFDEHIKKFIETPEVPKCNKGIPALFYSNLTSIVLNYSSLPSYNVTVSELKCCYKAFWRVEPKNDEHDNKIDYSENCIKFSESVNIADEFIQVVCTYDNSIKYKDMFSFVPLKDTSAKVTINPRPLNVLMIGLDAVSRLNLHRQMPKTVHFLQEIEAVELLGYNKVADNTFPNLMPVLTGMTENELTSSCWPSTKHYFDKCHFIWKDYKEKGYVTAYGEDSSWMGLFNYQRRGFQKQPTDYAYNYFNRNSEKEIGNCHKMNVYQCEGARYVYNDLLDYIKKFSVTMDKNNLPYFAFFWGASLSHDYLNKPRLGDDNYYNFFKSLQDEGHLNNTVLIFMSRMEERLPFVIISLPKWYRIQYQRAYKTLERNVRRLTTPFDLHETLRDLLHPFNLTDEYVDREDRKSRGYSFFSEIPSKRTCEDAAIESHWCTCQQSLEIDQNSTVVVEVADYAVEYINFELEGYAQCANLSLEEVLNARLMTHSNNSIVAENTIKDYMLTIRTSPGDGIFEVTIRRSVNPNKLGVMGTISRLNLYGKQSSCITDFHLKLYCYCKKLL
ncbi:hypothetical protein NQ314_009202 [Rhamnusium bicolor]|uniref:Uncharacterized protein n=1 Tax=Rhamnusium bicolor TaxID=1586634 RepID=A0AAV8Y342_9CUCU|nr:hypothetical protein NQ314_009202 [Rhamnusium bicolor]